MPSPGDLLVVGITGTRHLNDRGRRHIDAALSLLDPDATQLVVGGCVGVDAFAGNTGFDMGMKVHVVLPRERRWLDHDWREYATSWEEGGHYRARNERIVSLCQRLLAFPNHDWTRDNPRSGTWMTIRIALRVGRPVEIKIQDEE